MADNLQTLFIIWLAILPGTMFSWSFELLAERWTTGIKNNLLRFARFATLFHILVLPLTYHLWSSYWDQIIKGEYVNLLVWPGVAIYVIVPLSAGLFAGWATRKSEYKWYRWVRFLAGGYPAPRAWDRLFGRKGLSGWVYLQTKSGESKMGFYGQGSYVAGYPASQDIYLAHVVTVDDAGKLQPDELDKSRGLLIRWDEVEYMEFQPSERSRDYG